MNEKLNDHFPALDDDHKVFVLSPLAHTPTQTVIRCHLSRHFLIKRYASLGFIYQLDDVRKMMGIEKLHVIELMPQRLPERSRRERDAYEDLGNSVEERFRLMSGRHEAFCNLWIKVNLP